MNTTDLQGISYYMKDLDRQMQPRLTMFHKTRNFNANILRASSIVGMIFAAAILVPMI